MDTDDLSWQNGPWTILHHHQNTTIKPDLSPLERWALERRLKNQNANFP